MGRGLQTTPRKRAIICQYVKDGLNASQISAKLSLPRRTVSYIVRKFKETGSGEAGCRTGRPRVTTPREDGMLRRCAVKNPGYSSLEVKNETRVVASTRTIRRRLVNEFHLRAYRPARKPLIDDKQRRRRLAFCKRYLHWTEDQWKKVLFSDESTFCQFGSFTHFVRRPQNARFNRRYTVATVKHSPKVMVWGSFSAGGRGTLFFVPRGTTVNGKAYLDILKQKLRIGMQMHQCSIFQHDSAPAHTSRVVQEWLADNGIEVLEWPGNSPDLNPIENLWTMVKRKLCNLQAKEHG